MAIPHFNNNKRKEYTEANRAAWNEVIPLHQNAAKGKWDDAFKKPGYVCMSDLEVDLIKRIGIAGMSVAHLCCNNGVELLSLKNLGAEECVGFDISEAAIQEARERASKCQIDCQFVLSDIYDIGPEYEERFNLVYISSGSLGWLPDLKLFFAKAEAMLDENGLIFIHEIHPFSEMLLFDNDKSEEVLRIVEPYFKTGPYIDYGGLDYVGGVKYDSNKPQYWFVHTMSDIVMGLVDNSISIEYLSEFKRDISTVHKRVERENAGIPLSYILVGRVDKMKRTI